MNSLETWLWRYHQSHLHPTNVLLHKICVPLILFSLMGMIFSFSAILGLTALLSLAFYYLRLSKKLGLTMAIFFLLFLLAFSILENRLGIGALHYFTIFVLAWLGQFIGHKIEGKKPSFFEDLHFLLIGPLWVAHSLWGKLSRGPR